MVQKQAQRNDVHTSDMDFNSWISTVDAVRGESITGQITEWNFESETVTIKYEIPEISDQEFSEKLDATVKPNEVSEFEKFLSRYGYDRYSSNVIQGETVDLSVNRNEESLEFSLIVDDTQDTDDKDESIEKNGSDSIGMNLVTCLEGITLALIPFVNIMLFADIYKRDRIDMLVDTEKQYTLLTISATAAFMMTYVLLPILMVMQI